MYTCIWYAIIANSHDSTCSDGIRLSQAHLGAQGCLGYACVSGSRAKPAASSGLVTRRHNAICTWALCDNG